MLAIAICQIYKCTNIQKYKYTPKAAGTFTLPFGDICRSLSAASGFAAASRGDALAIAICQICSMGTNLHTVAVLYNTCCTMHMQVS